MLRSVTTSGWQQSAGGKGSEIKESEMARSGKTLQERQESLTSCQKITAVSKLCISLTLRSSDLALRVSVCTVQSTQSHRLD